MTLMGIQFLNHQEQARHNLATEAETNRSNLANETETKRSNQAREKETNRSNLAKEAETNRANLANERENRRSNLARENETRRHNWQSEQIEGKKVEYQHQHNLAMERLEHDSNANQLLRTILDKAGSVEARTAANDLIYHISNQGYDVGPGYANQILKKAYDFQKEHPLKEGEQFAANTLSNLWEEIKGIFTGLLKSKKF